MKPVRHIRSKTVVLPTRDIDTDQIIAARFLTTTSKEGLGQSAFFDLRHNKDGSEPWALLDYGFEAVISTEIADIFRSNSLKNGLVAIVVDQSTHAWLVDNPGAELAIDIEATSIALPDGKTVEFSMDGFARYCLLEGIDQLGFLRNQLDIIENFEEARSWKP